MPKQRKVAIQHSAPMTKRQRARWEKERSQQQQVLLAVSVILGLALVLIVGGLVWQKVIVPSRTVASIGSVEIDNGEYQDYRQIIQATNAIQQNTLLSQYTQYGLDGSSIQQELEASFAGLTESYQPLDYEILNQLIDLKVVQTAGAEQGITITDEQVVTSLAELVRNAKEDSGVSTEVMSPTDALSDTANLSDTASLSTTEGVKATQTPVEEANSVDVELRSNYDNISQFFFNPVQVNIAVTPVTKLPFSFEDYKAFIFDAQRDQLIRAELGKQLVDESSVSREPTFDVDQLVVQVVLPATNTDEISATLWAEGELQINALKDQLDAGTAFDDLLAQNQTAFSTMYSGVKVEDGLQPLSYWSNFQISEPISTAEVGMVGEPYRSSLGWHLIRVNERGDQPNQSELDTKRGEAIAEWVTSKREALNIKMFPEPTATPVPPTTDPALLPDPYPTLETASEPTPEAEATPEVTPEAEATPEVTPEAEATPEATPGATPTP